MRNAHELTFGVEIETTIAEPVAYAPGGVRIGGYYGAGEQVPYLPTGWVAKRDGSINASSGRVGCEIVSPVLMGIDGLEQVIGVCKALTANGHKVNVSCGVHIHVGWNRHWPSDALARLISLVSSNERALYAITGTKSRERGAWCGGVRRYGNDKDAKQRLDRGRFHLLNLTNLSTGRRDTVEFRAFSGSTNAVKITAWIQICLGLVEKALAGKKKAPWVPKRKTSPFGESMTGQMEVYHLTAGLGWKEKKRHHFGLLREEDRKSAMAELYRLAKKYDADA